MILYQLYEAERAKTDAELREAAAVQGQIAAAVSRREPGYAALNCGPRRAAACLAGAAVQAS